MKLKFWLRFEVWSRILSEFYVQTEAEVPFGKKIEAEFDQYFEAEVW